MSQTFADAEWPLVLAAAETIPVLRRNRFLSQAMCADDLQASISFALRSLVIENAEAT
jgi:hypothetical protein